MHMLKHLGVFTGTHLSKVHKLACLFMLLRAKKIMHTVDNRLFKIIFTHGASYILSEKGNGNT